MTAWIDFGLVDSYEIIKLSATQVIAKNSCHKMLITNKWLA